MIVFVFFPVLSPCANQLELTITLS